MLTTYVIFRIITVLYFLVVAATILVVILEKRQPVKTMAWTLVLIALPVAGILLFYFFGQDIRKERRFQHREINQMKRKDLANYLPHDNARIPESCKPLATFFLRRNFAPPFLLGTTKVFQCGEDKFISLLKDIANAKEHINLEYFIFEGDAIGRIVSDFLKDAVKRGVVVRIMYDDVGCWSVKNKFYNDMSAAGIIVKSFMPVRFSRFTRRVNYRNHRKIAVIDGKIGYIGGMNIAMRYLYGRNGEGWKDMHLRLTGSAVYGLQQTFVADWYYNCNEMLATSGFYPQTKNEESEHRGCLQIVTASPASELPYIMNGFVWAIMNARKYFYLTTPYLMPTEQVLNAIQVAACAGIDVRIMVPAKSEHYWIKAANESYYGDVLKAGAKVYAYGPEFIHAKYFVCDDMLCTVGSTNTDFRSFEDNFEANAFIYDEKLAVNLKNRFENDLRSCEFISRRRWKKRSKIQRVAESFVRIVSPLL